MKQGYSKFHYWRKSKSAFTTFLCLFSALIAIVPLFLIFFYALSQGIETLNIDFFTQMPKPVGESGGGMANAIVEQ